MTKFYFLILSFLLFFGSALNAETASQSEKLLTLKFQDTQELVAAIDQLEPAQLETTRRLILYTFDARCTEQTAIDFASLVSFSNLRILELHSLSNPVIHQNPFYSPLIADSVLSIPILPTLEKIAFHRLHLEYNSGGHQQYAYPFDKVEAIFEKLSSFPKLRSLILGGEFFHMYDVFYKYRENQASPLMHHLPLLEELELSENSCVYSFSFCYPSTFFVDIDKLTQLRSLSFSGRGKLTQEILDKIPQLEQLEELNLNFTTFIDYEPARQLAPLPHLKRLHVRGLRHSQFPHKGIFLSSPFVESYPELEFLDFSGSTFFPGEQNGYGSLMDLNRHPNLKHLVLVGCEFTAAHIEQLNHMHFPSLTSLSMWSTAVRGVDWNQLAPKLQYLNLDQTNIGGKDIASIALLSQLEELHLNSTKVPGSTIKKLATLSHLRKLDLGGNKLTGADFSALARLPSLRFLGLVDAELMMDDLEGLKQLQQLEVLDLRGSRNPNITHELLQNVQKALPNTKVLF